MARVEFFEEKTLLHVMDYVMEKDRSREPLSCIRSLLYVTEPVSPLVMVLVRYFFCCGMI